MRKLKYLLLCLLLLNVACVKDYSTPGDIEINEVTISGIEVMYTLDLGGTLEIDPVIKTKSGDDSQLDYVWYKYNDLMTDADTISFEKKLVSEINDVEPGVPNTLVLKVTDRSTGVYYSEKTQLYTKAMYSAGILALTKDNGNMDMAFVRSSDSKVVTKIFSSVNPKFKLGVGADKIFFLDPFLTNPKDFRKVIIATNDENIGFVMTSDILSVETSIADFFIIPLDKSKKYTINHYGHTSAEEMLFINGQVHDRPVSMWAYTAKFNPAVVFPGVPNYSLSPIIMPMDALFGGGMVFDNVSGKFAYFSDGNTFYFLEESNEIVFDHFDPNALKGFELVAAGTIADEGKYVIGSWYTLMKNIKSGKYSMLSFTYGLDDDEYEFFNTLGNDEILSTKCPMLYKATTILGGDTFTPDTANPWTYPRTGFAGMMFYLVDNSVYAFDVMTQSELKLIDGAKEGFTIDKIVISKTESIKNGKIVYEPRLGLCIRDNAATTKKGGVAFYRITGLGGLSAKQYFKKTGFCDQVIDFVEKLK